MSIASEKAAAAAAKAAEAAEIRRLRETHFLYDKYLPRWILQLGSFEGGAMFINKTNIVKHARETDEDYNERIERAHYINHIQPIVKFYTNFIYAETIQRDGGTDGDLFKAFIQNVNNKGDDVSTYMRRICDDMQVMGMVYTLVDAPTKPDIGRDYTAQEEQDLGMRPYWCRIMPMEVIDWVRDEFGYYQYAKRKQVVKQLGAMGVRTYEKYTEWYVDRVLVSMVDISSIAEPHLESQTELSNELGKVPLVLTINDECKEDPEMGRSFINDLAYNAREILNITSLIDEFLAKQCFAILVKEADGVVPTREQNQGEIGTANALEVPLGVTHLPTYLAPPAEPAKFLQAEREIVKNEMFRHAAQDAMGELFNGETKSGFSQAQSFTKTMPHIATRADQLQRTEMALYALTWEWMNKKFAGVVKYKDNYSITNLTDALTQFMMMVRDCQITSELFIKTELKRLVHEYDGSMSQDDIKQVESEIDAINIDDWNETQKEALLGPPKLPGESPASQQKPKSSNTTAEVASKSRSAVSSTKKLKGK